MKTETLKTDALKWWEKLTLKQAECLGNKYFHRDYGIVAIDDTTDEEIQVIYVTEMKTKTLIENLEDAYKSIPRYSIGNGMYNFNSISEYGKACIKHGANWQKEKDKANYEALLSALKKADDFLTEFCRLPDIENTENELFLKSVSHLLVMDEAIKKAEQ